LQEKIYAKKKNGQSKKGRTKDNVELYSKMYRYPEAMYKNNPQIQKKETVKKGKRNMNIIKNT